jgi:hypothetical protein
LRSHATIRPERRIILISVETLRWKSFSIQLFPAFDLKIRFVPRCKHASSRFQTPPSECCIGTNHCSWLQRYEKHKFSLWEESRILYVCAYMSFSAYPGTRNIASDVLRSTSIKTWNHVSKTTNLQTYLATHTHTHTWNWKIF